MSNVILKKRIVEEINSQYYDKCLGIVFGMEDETVEDSGRLDILFIDCETKNEYKERCFYNINDDIDHIIINGERGNLISGFSLN